MSLPRFDSKALLVLAAVIAAAAAPAATGIDAAQSRVTASFQQMGVKVERPFKQVAGTVVFDPAKPAAASARIEVATGSFDLGDPDYTAEARKPEWLSATAHPLAIFTATGLKPLGGDRYEATGTLSLKGRSQTLTVPVTVVRAPAATRFEGSLPISRKAFVIGDAEWNDVVADTVTVKFRIVQPAA